MSIVWLLDNLKLHNYKSSEKLLYARKNYTFNSGLALACGRRLKGREMGKTIVQSTGGLDSRGRLKVFLCSSFCPLINHAKSTRLWMLSKLSIQNHTTCGGWLIRERNEENNNALQASPTVQDQFYV